MYDNLLNADLTTQLIGQLLAVKQSWVSALPCQIDEISDKQQTKWLFYYSSPDC